LGCREVSTREPGVKVDGHGLGIAFPNLENRVRGTLQGQKPDGIHFLRAAVGEIDQDANPNESPENRINAARPRFPHDGPESIKLDPGGRI
jgi:hypothetical protein